MQPFSRPVLKTKVGSQSSEDGVIATGKHHQTSSCYFVERRVSFPRNLEMVEQYC